MSPAGVRPAREADGEATIFVERGFHKLIAKVIAADESSPRLLLSSGVWAVGTHRRHGRLDGERRDVVVLERSL